MGKRKSVDEEEIFKKEPKVKNMNWEIWNYPCYKLTPRGRLVEVLIQNTDEYNHQITQCHHYIPYNLYKKNRKWFQDRGIKQKLILMPIVIHEQVHNQAINNMSDEQFLQTYNISRWDLVFNRKHTEY